MSRAQFIPFSDDHMAYFAFREAEEKSLGQEGIDRLLLLAKHGWGCSIICEGKILAVAGYYEMWNGVYEIWMIPSKHIRKYLKAFCREIRRLIDQIEETHTHLHRMQTSSIADKEHTRFMKFAGFHKEGDLEKYSATQQDFIQWARIPDGR